MYFHQQQNQRSQLQKNYSLCSLRIYLDAIIIKIEAIKIKNTSEIKNDLSIIYGNIVRPINIRDENTLIFHKEYIDKGIYNIDSNKEVKINSSSYSQNIFTEGEYVIHEDYGLGIYSGLEVIQVNNSNNEYLKIIYLNDEKLYVPLRNIEKISPYHHKIEDKELILDSLSSVKWKSKKNKAKKRAFDHADCKQIHLF